MNSSTAVVSRYGCNDGPSDPYQPFVGGLLRMSSKRRRVNSGEYARPDPWDATQQHAFAPQLGNALSLSGSASGVAEYSSGAIHDTTAGASSFHASSDPETGVQWHGTEASRYPDVASYSQQPYFYQHTDPTTYNSPWPPKDIAPIGTNAGSYTAPGLCGTMPYFPPQSTLDVAESSVDTAVPSFQSFEQGIEPPAQQYAVRQVSHGRSHNDVPARRSASFFEDASMQMKIQSLPILGNLATQLIHTIARASYNQIQEIMRGNETEDSQAYTTLKNLFDQTRKVYSRETPFIDAIAIQMFQPSQQEIIRKANIATFMSSILGAHDVSFFHLNEFFMETFVPLGHRLLKWQGAIFLELKTQSYISALMNSDGSPEAMLDELFPADLDAQILTRHPDTPSLSPSEQDFIDRSRARKRYLLAEHGTDEALRELPKKYQWHDFVREFASCINKNVEGILNVPTKTQPGFGSSATDRRNNGAAGAVDGSLTQNGQSSGRNGSGLPGMQSLSISLPRELSGGQSSRGDAGDSSKKGASATTMRSPWTKAEEDALLNGLGQVNGPHWSQILALYGRGGSISEVLKDRNQVQLKDKARNLKLWYLKMGKEVPSALRGVTGELRKRGGARARAALGLTDDDDPDGLDADDGVDAADAGLARSYSSKGSKKKSRR